MRGDCCRLNPSRLIIIISPQFTTQASCVDIRSATRVDTHAALPAALLLFLFPPNRKIESPPQIKTRLARGAAATVVLLPASASAGRPAAGAACGPEGLRSGLGAEAATR